MYEMTPLRVFAVLLFYAALWILIRTYRPRIPRAEWKTFLVLGLGAAVIAFVANYLLYLAGFMSFLPWLNNFIHTFVWIGFCLTWLYLAVRGQAPMAVQFVLFATFSLIVKVFEQQILATWEHPRFFILDGNAAYVIGWSLVDGLIPVGMFLGLRLLRHRVSGLVVR